MKNNKQSGFGPFEKDFYRISKERLETYLIWLEEASETLKEIKPVNKESKEKIDDVRGKIIDALNSLNGFRNLEEDEVCGRLVDHFYLFNWTGIDNAKFYTIEFPEGLKEKT